MKADPSISSSETSNHPPLAHDANGFKIAVPEGTTHWRILRQTRGRPKPVPGQDMQPGRFSLEMTHEDLLEQCGPGMYRIEALDEFGNRLACITTVTIGGDVAAPVAEPVSGAASRAQVANDLRIALETIQQLSKAHSESLQSLATAQADWIKTLATAKAIPRNGFAQLAAPTADANALEPVPAKPSWMTLLEPAMPAIANAVMRNLGSFFGPKPEEPRRRNGAPVIDRNLDVAAAFHRERKALSVKPIELPTFEAQAAMVCALLEPEEREPASAILNDFIKPMFVEAFVRMSPSQCLELIRPMLGKRAKAAS